MTTPFKQKLVQQQLPQRELPHSQRSVTYAIQSFDETGAMRAPYLLLKGFVAAGWQVEIVTMAGENNQKLEMIWENVPIIKLKGATKRARLFRLAAHFWGRRKHNLVITWIWDWHCYGLLLSHLLFGTKYVVVLDSYTHRAFGNDRDKRFQALRYEPILRFASLILGEAPACVDAIRKHLPDANVQLMPSSLWRSEIEAIETQWQQEAWQPQRRPIILYAGRLVERKNVHCLLEAFGKIASRYPEWSLEIIGPVSSSSEGYLQNLQRQAQSQGIAGQVHFLPGLSGEALYRKYRQSAIYALPSAGEGFPTSILEAMYFGGAIIAGNSGYVAYQLLGDCGLLHTPGNIEELTIDLERLMTDENERIQFMQRARQRMLNTFTWESYFPTLEAQCQMLIR